jgi:hypothetical protein
LRTWKWAAGLVALAVVALVAGCGDEDATSDGSSASRSAETVTTSSISKARLIKEGDAICEAGRKKLAAAAEQLFSTPPQEREGRGRELVSTVLVPVLKADIARLRELGAPRGDEDQVEAILEGFQGILRTAEREPEVFLTAGRPAATDPWRETDRKAESYGFTECPRS